MGGSVWGRRGRQIGGRWGENREGDRDGGNSEGETNPEGCRTSDVDIKTELKSVSGAFEKVSLMSIIVISFFSRCQMDILCLESSCYFAE